ncbi:MAG: hypothetical protein LBI39_02820 [Puniceicoccales bacterium]|jgi:hypothetical protein|nr:hypothetical protein [Puniceicoccales bacterium]
MDVLHCDVTIGQRVELVPLGERFPAKMVGFEVTYHSANGVGELATWLAVFTEEVGITKNGELRGEVGSAVQAEVLNRVTSVAPLVFVSAMLVANVPSDADALRMAAAKHSQGVFALIYSAERAGA